MTHEERAKRVNKAKSRLYKAINEISGFHAGVQDLPDAIRLVRKAESDLIAVALDEASD